MRSGSAIGDRPLYITFDLDCLDPTVAPGVANIEAGIEGFGIDQVTDLIRSVRGRNIIGGDVVCLMPTVDSPNAITSYRAMAVRFEIISLIATLPVLDGGPGGPVPARG